MNAKANQTFFGISLLLSSFLIAQSTEPQALAAQNDPCHGSPCSRYNYTSCSPFHKDTFTSFECLCQDLPFITIAHTEYLSKKYQRRIQICQVKNLCQDPTYACTGPNVTCSYDVRHLPTGAYQPLTFCTCTANGQVLPNHRYSCQQTCNGACHHSSSCATDARTNGSIICNCRQGWTGEKCDQPVSSRTSTGLIIATIVVSIIAALSLVSLGVAYFKL